MDEKDLARFMGKVEVLATGCWRFHGTPAGAGYRTFYLKGERPYAHRASYEHHKGPIPEGLQIHHACSTRDCVNPDHLEAVTQRENLRLGSGWAGMNAQKTHCPQGHEYTPENTIGTTPRRPGEDPGRRCRTCHRERCRRDSQKRRDAARAAAR